LLKLHDKSEQEKESIHTFKLQLETAKFAIILELEEPIEIRPTQASFILGL
jgi:hypothetical protein